MRALVLCVQAFLVAVQCLHKSVLGAARRRRDLIYENMVMRNKYNSTTRDEMRKLMVGGGILERKVIAAKNGTENSHEESREMECCNLVRVTGHAMAEQWTPWQSVILMPWVCTRKLACA